MTQGLREVNTTFYHGKLEMFALFYSGKLSRFQSRNRGIDPCLIPGLKMGRDTGYRIEFPNSYSSDLVIVSYFSYFAILFKFYGANVNVNVS